MLSRNSPDRLRPRPAPKSQERTRSKVTLFVALVLAIGFVALCVRMVQMRQAYNQLASAYLDLAAQGIPSYGVTVDDLSQEELDLCRRSAQAACDTLKEQLKDRGAVQAELLHTEVLLVGAPPASASEEERAVWADYYDGWDAVVSCLVLEETADLPELRTARTVCFLVRDGEARDAGDYLNGILTAAGQNPVLPGVTAVNLGGAFNFVLE